MRLLSLTAFLATTLAAQGTFTVPRHLKLIPPLTSPQSSIIPVKLVSPGPDARTCAIPLLNVVPRDANLDRGMIIQPRTTSRMPLVTPPAPSCDDVRRP